MTAGLDVSALQGIDVHVHVESDGHGQLSLDDELLAASAKYFKADNDRAPTVEQIADYYRPRQLAAVVFTVDAETATGHPALSSEEVADRPRPTRRADPVRLGGSAGRRGGGTRGPGG